MKKLLLPLLSLSLLLFGCAQSPVQPVPAVEPVLPELWWADFDGDGASELAVKYMIRNHTRSHVFELHFYAPEEDGGWTDCGLTDSDADALLAQQVAYAYDPGSRTVTAALPDERVSYRLGDQDPEPAGDAPLRFLDRAFYRYRDGSFTGVYGTGVLLQGLGAPYYFASVTADVRYDGASISLEHLHLTALGGV